jgi:hypothetical protein
MRSAAVAGHSEQNAVVRITNFILCDSSFLLLRLTDLDFCDGFIGPEIIIIFFMVVSKKTRRR